MGSIPVRVMNKIPDLRIRDFFMQPVRGIEQHGRPQAANNSPVDCCLVRGSQRLGMSTVVAAVLTRTGIEQHGPAQQGKQSAQWAVA